MQRQTAADAAAAKNSALNPQATDESLVEKGWALQHHMRSQLMEASAEVAVTEDLTLSILAEEVATEQRPALQRQLCHQLREAEAVVSEDWTLSTLAEEVAVEQDLALSQQTKEANDMLRAELLARSASSTRDS